MWSTAPLSELIERGRGHCCKFQCAYTEIDYYLIVCHDTFKLHGQPNIDLIVFTSGWFSGEMPYYFRKCGGNFGCSAMVSKFGRKYTINNSHSSENDFGLQQVRPIDVVTPVNRSIPQCGTPIVISFSIFLYSSFRVLSLPQYCSEIMFEWQQNNMRLNIQVVYVPYISNMSN